MNLTQVHASNVEALKVIYNSLVILCKVFYSLNFQVSMCMYIISMYKKYKNLFLQIILLI